MNAITVLESEPADSMREESRLPQDKRIAGNPRQETWNSYADASGRFFAGIWQSEPGKWRIRYTEEEYCHLLDGVSVITDEQGRALRVHAGDRFVIPRGFEGTWEVVETTRKIYVIYDAGPQRDA